MHPSWQAFLARQGATLDAGRVEGFGDPHGELRAAADGSIIADLSHLGLLQVDGEDAAAFLQGQVTNDVKLLDGSNSHYAGYCTPKGRLLAIFLAFAHHGHFHLQCNGALREQVAKRLKMYVLRSKVTIADVSDDIIRFGVAGGEAEQALRRMFAQLPGEPHRLASLEAATLLRLPGPTPRYELFTAPERAEALWTELRASCTPAGSAAWEWLDIRAGIPDIAPATQEAFVPQMVNLDLLGGISFKKGCYTGQEIVARTHYLGKVKRRTLLAAIDAAEVPAAGAAVYAAGSAEPVGMVVSAAPAPAGGCNLLAELRLESVHEALRLGAPEGVALRLQDLPYGLEAA